MKLIRLSFTSFLGRALIGFIIWKLIKDATHPTRANSSTMSLCFGEAWEAKAMKKITEEEYFGHLLAHFRGARHPEDSGKDLIMTRFDPVGASIRAMALNNEYQVMQGEISFHYRG